MNYDKDIVINAYYVINYFSNQNTEVTHLKLQKLMYFLEAIYMREYKGDKMFDSEFYAWPYGPVSKKLYDKFKMFSDTQIKIDKNDKELGNKISEKNKKCVNILYLVFGKMSASDLVTLTHLPNSPWAKVYDAKKCSSIETECIIPKSDTLQWFNGIILGDVE